MNTQNVALDESLKELPPVLRQSNTTFVNLRAALDDVEPLINTAKPATKNLAPFLAELRPVLAKFIPLTRNLSLAFSRPGSHNDTAELLATIPAVQEQASNTFPHAETAIAAFQPQLNFLRSYTPDIFNGISKLGQVSGFYDGSGHYIRGATSLQNLFKDEGGTLVPLKKSEQFQPFGTDDDPEALPRRRDAASRRQLGPLREPAAHRQLGQSVRMRHHAGGERPVKKLIAGVVVVAAIVAAIVLIAGGGSNDGYVVRAVFDNGSFMVSGEQVRVAGANVGTIKAVSVSLPGRTDGGRKREVRRRPRQGGDRARNRKPELPGLPPGRQLRNPPAVADRREVRQLPADHAAGPGGEAGRRRCARSRRANRARASTCCRSAATRPASTPT